VGSTIGNSVRTSHFTDDSYCSPSELAKLLSERGFKLSSLFMADKKFIEKTLAKGNIESVLALGYTLDDIFSVHKIFNYYEFSKIDEENIEKYDLKYKDSNNISGTQITQDFEKNRVVDIDYHIGILYSKFGNKIIPYINPNKSFDKFNASIIELVEEIEGVKFNTYKSLLSRVNGVDSNFIKLLLDRGIEFSDKDIADEVNKEKYGISCYNLLSVRPQLFKYLINKLNSLSHKDTLELKKLDGIPKDELNKIIYEAEKRESAKYIRNLMPSNQYENYGYGRRENTEILNSLGVKEIDPEIFMSDNIWGRIKRHELYRGSWGDEPLTIVYAFMACAKLNRLDELKFLFPLSQEMVGRIIRSALQVVTTDDDGKEKVNYGYMRNGRTNTIKNFYLDEDERNRLFEWMTSNIGENDIKSRTSNLIYDKSIARHEAFSLIYYVNNWGFDRYLNLISKIIPMKDDKWTNGVNGESVVERNRSRADYFDHIFGYLNSIGDTEAVGELVDKILDMNLKNYEVERLTYKMISMVGYWQSKTQKTDDVYKVVTPIFRKHGYLFKFHRSYYSNTTEFSVEKIK
jgi:hypothetical protein